MAIYLAHKTQAAIDALLELDQGAKFREFLGKVIPHMSDAYSTKTDPFRPHLGASILGASCGRKVWYSWHWATREKFKGRMLRLFNRGHLEEARFIALLLMIGVEVYQHDANGKQFRIKDCAGHYSGSGDGIAVGIPDLDPKTAALLEFKTHNTKSFAELVKKGVKVAKPEHYVQMQQYMGKMGLVCALYGAVNKDTDDIHWELIPFERENFEQYLHRAHKIVWMEQIPSRINNSPGWFECNWCSHKKLCHGLGQAPDRNCRTCSKATPIDDGQDGGSWHCSMYNANIPLTTQFVGCDAYTVNKEM